MSELIDGTPWSVAEGEFAIYLSYFYVIDLEVYRIGVNPETGMERGTRLVVDCPYAGGASPVQGLLPMTIGGFNYSATYQFIPSTEAGGTITVGDIMVMPV